MKTKETTILGGQCPECGQARYTWVAFWFMVVLFFLLFLIVAVPVRAHENYLDRVVLECDGDCEVGTLSTPMDVRGYEYLTFHWKPTLGSGTLQILDCPTESAETHGGCSDVTSGIDVTFDGASVTAVSLNSHGFYNECVNAILERGNTLIKTLEAACGHLKGSGPWKLSFVVLKVNKATPDLKGTARVLAVRP